MTSFCNVAFAPLAAGRRWEELAEAAAEEGAGVPRGGGGSEQETLLLWWVLQIVLSHSIPNKPKQTGRKSPSQGNGVPYCNTGHVGAGGSR